MPNPDSSDVQLRRWAAQRFGINADDISFFSFDTWTSEPYGCSTCGKDTDVENNIYVSMKLGVTPSQHTACWADAFEMIRELTADYS